MNTKLKTFILLAGTAIGAFPDERTAVRQALAIERTLTPNPDLADFYNTLFQNYRAIHDALAPVYAKL